MLIEGAARCVNPWGTPGVASEAGQMARREEDVAARTVRAAMHVCAGWDCQWAFEIQEKEEHVMRSTAVVLVLVCWCSCAVAADQGAADMVLKIKAELNVVKSEVARLREDIDKLQKKDVAALRKTQAKIMDALKAIEKRLKVLEDAACGEAKPATQPTTSTPKASSGDKCLVSLRSWDYRPEKGRFDRLSYRISFSLHNGYPKRIKLIEAGIHFTDLLDNHLYGIKIDPDLHIPSSETVSHEGRYPVNEFINEQLRMLKMDKEDVKAELRVDRIVFEDNSVLAF